VRAEQFSISIVTSPINFKIPARYNICGTFTSQPASIKWIVTPAEFLINPAGGYASLCCALQQAVKLSLAA
jgi:hypothetical protein